MSFVNAPIQDLLIRIKNAYMARKKTVENVIYSKFKENILKLLAKNEFIKWFEIYQDWNKKQLKIFLNQIQNTIEDIPHIKLHSKPSKRIYVSYNEIKKVAGWKWIWIISTNKWVITWKEAKFNKVWWEYIADIY